MSEKTLRRRADAHHAQSVPVRLVINYVGICLIISLLAASYLLMTDRDAAVMLAVTGSCVTGLIGLLGRTQPPVEQGPSGAPTDPVSVTAPPNAPVSVVEQPKDDAPADTEPVDLDDDGGEDLSDDSTAVKP